MSHPYCHQSIISHTDLALSRASQQRIRLISMVSLSLNETAAAGGPIENGAVRRETELNTTGHITQPASKLVLERCEKSKPISKRPLATIEP